MIWHTKETLHYQEVAGNKRDLDFTPAWILDMQLCSCRFAVALQTLKTMKYLSIEKMKEHSDVSAKKL